MNKPFDTSVNFNNSRAFSSIFKYTRQTEVRKRVKGPCQKAVVLLVRTTSTIYLIGYARQTGSAISSKDGGLCAMRFKKTVCVLLHINKKR